MKDKAVKFSAFLALALTLLAAGRLIAPAAETKPLQSSGALAKAKKIRFSVLKFSGLRLAEVITMLHDESVKRDTEKKGVKIALGPNAKHFVDAEVNVDLKDVTLAEALERVAESVGLKVEATETELLLAGKKAKP